MNDEKLARTYFEQLMLGLKALHDAGIVHRDLKPQNLLLDSNYDLKITDFGLSKLFGENEKKMIMSTSHVGTKGFQAPELLLGHRKYTEKCDIFSVGVILFIFIMAYPPFEEATGKNKWFRKIAKK